MKKWHKLLLIAALACLFIIAISNIVIITSTKKYIIHEIDDLPKNYVALVLGAKTYKDHLSNVLEDRVNAGIALKEKGIVEKLLLSGDHREKRYDETNSMKRYVLQNDPQINKADIFLDHAGFDTYDSIVRAKKIFEIDSMIIVTQDFHIYRSVFIARNKGINAIGYALDESKYSKMIRFSWQVREALARVKAVFNVMANSKPKFLGEKIPIKGNGQFSWD
jgi:SanA protein